MKLRKNLNENFYASERGKISVNIIKCHQFIKLILWRKKNNIINKQLHVTQEIRHRSEPRAT